MTEQTSQFQGDGAPNAFRIDTGLLGQLADSQVPHISNSKPRCYLRGPGAKRGFRRREQFEKAAKPLRTLKIDEQCTPIPFRGDTGADCLEHFLCNFCTPFASSNAKDGLGVYRPTVTYLREFGAVVLLLASFLTPAMACAVADSPMTSEERACCQMMGSKCGQMGMPESHGCCHKIPGSVYDNALNTKALTLHPGAVPVIWLPAHQLGVPTSLVHGWVEQPDYISSRRSPPSTISILRI